MDAVGGADHDDGHVRRGQTGVHIGGEIGIARRIEQVDLDVVDGERGQGRRDGQLAGDLLGLEVTGGGALLDRASSGDHAGGGQEGLGQRRLPGTVMADESDVSDCGRVS